MYMWDCRASSLPTIIAQHSGELIARRKYAHLQREEEDSCGGHTHEFHDPTHIIARGFGLVIDCTI